ncbi:hypothetical protein EOM09_05480 [bacterium]|nr:hypothetical protein [bacterium]
MKKNIYKFIIEYTSLEYEIYSYSYNLFFSYLFVLTLTLVFSIRINLLLQELTFWITCLFLKKNLGSIHFESKILCIVTSILFSLFISASYYLPPLLISWKFFISGIVLCSTYYFKVANHPNKDLTIEEIKFYTKKALNTEIIFSIFAIFPFPLLNSKYQNIIIYTLLFSIINVIVAKITKQG